jgi:hypothetical protein
MTDLSILLQITDRAAFLRELLADAEYFSEEGVTLKCVGRDRIRDTQDDGLTYHDGQTQAYHILTPDKAQRGLELFAELVEKGAGIMGGQSIPMSAERFPDPNWWDMYDPNVLVQLSLLGKVVYE